VKQGRLFTYRPPAHEKLKIFNVSIKHFAETSKRVDLKRFHDRAAALKIKRNMLAHGLWDACRGKISESILSARY